MFPIMGFDVADAQHDIVHVDAGTGADGDDGSTYALAKLTIAGALAVVPDGGTIIIWPGTYAENVDLDTAGKAVNLVGTNPYACKIDNSANGDNDEAVTMENGCGLYNLWLEGGDGKNAIVGTTKKMCRISNCWIQSNEAVDNTCHGIQLGGTGWLVENCYISALSRGVNVVGGNGCIFKGCFISVVNTGGGSQLTDHYCVNTNGGVQFIDCHFKLDQGTGEITDARDYYVAKCSGFASFTRCSMEGSVVVTGTSNGNYAVLFNSAEDGPVLLKDCILAEDFAAVGATEYDILDDNAACVTVTRGTRVAVNSITGTLDRLTDADGKVHASDLDRVGGETPESHNTAVPANATAGSINALVRTAASNR